MPPGPPGDRAAQRLDRDQIRHERLCGRHLKRTGDAEHCEHQEYEPWVRDPGDGKHEQQRGA
jgi:hypothetical protein